MATVPGGHHRKALAAIFERPTRADVRWNEAVALIRALGGEISEGRGSRVRFALIGRRAVFHRPHPRPEMVKGAVEALRDYLIDTGIQP
jgi:hypothetical protein